MAQLVIDVPEAHELPDSAYPYVYENAVAHVVAFIVKEEDGSLTLRREVGLHFSDPDDGETIFSVIRDIEEKLDEVGKPKSKLWTGKWL